MVAVLTRRAFLAVAAMAPPLAATLANASEPVVELEWGDLIPKADAKTTFGIVQHGQMSQPAEQQSDKPDVTAEFNGKNVRIPGYVVPLDFDGAGTKEFLLVPYVGACIHVPPPPANQLIYVTSAEPFELDGLFDAVYVTGMFGTAATSTQLAEVGYSLSADKIEPYE